MRLFQDLLHQQVVQPVQTVKLAEPVPGMSMLYTGPWSPAHHTNCFWGYRAQVAAYIIACSRWPAIRVSGETAGEGRGIDAVAEFAPAIASELWGLSLGWVLGPHQGDQGTTPGVS